MAVKIPLNRFKSKFVSLSGTASETLYTAPDRRASIIVMGQISNTRTYDRTVTVFVRSASAADSPNPQDYVVYPLVQDFLIPANDARPFVSGRLVLEGVDFDKKQVPDILLATDTTASVLGGTLLTQGITAHDTGLVVTLAVLDTVNTD